MSKARFLVAALAGLAVSALAVGDITTVAGGWVGDGGPATSASLSFPRSVALDPSGNLFIADGSNDRVRRVDAATGIITTAAVSRCLLARD